MSLFYMELRFGERHIEVDTLTALTGFFKQAFRFGYNNMYVIFSWSYQKSRPKAMEHYHRYSFPPPLQTITS